MSNQVLVGADPELFIKKAGLKSYASAYGVIPGTKAQPHPVKSGAVQVDGMALEFNIDPAATEQEFVNNITTVMAELKKLTPGYEFHLESFANFTPSVLKVMPEVALELGCDPDFNAYTGSRNEIPKLPAAGFRTAAGHIHVGWGKGLSITDPEHLEACKMMAIQMDYYVGMGSKLFDHDQTRRQLYGKAGAFRPKPYGMEYRVLSNAWLKEERFTRWVYQATIKAFNELVNGVYPFKDYEFLARGIIDKDDYGPNTEGFIIDALKAMGLPNPLEM